MLKRQLHHSQYSSCIFSLPYHPPDFSVKRSQSQATTTTRPQMCGKRWVKNINLTWQLRGKARPAWEFAGSLSNSWQIKVNDCHQLSRGTRRNTCSRERCQSNSYSCTSRTATPKHCLLCDLSCHFLASWTAAKVFFTFSVTHFYSRVSLAVRRWLNSENNIKNKNI